MTDTMREEFEAWIRVNNSLTRDYPMKWYSTDGSYDNTYINVAWSAFQAGRASAPVAAPDVLRQALEALEVAGASNAWHCFGECRAFSPDAAVQLPSEVDATIRAAIASIRSALATHPAPALPDDWLGEADRLRNDCEHAFLTYIDSPLEKDGEYAAHLKKARAALRSHLELAKGTK